MSMKRKSTPKKFHNPETNPEIFNLDEKINEKTLFVDNIANNIYSLLVNIEDEKYQPKIVKKKISFKKKKQTILVDIFNDHAKKKKIFGPYLKKEFTLDDQIKEIKNLLVADQGTRLDFIKRETLRKNTLRTLDLNYLKNKNLLKIAQDKNKNDIPIITEESKSKIPYSEESKNTSNNNQSIFGFYNQFNKINNNISKLTKTPIHENISNKSFSSEDSSSFSSIQKNKKTSKKKTTKISQFENINNTNFNFNSNKFNLEKGNKLNIINPYDEQEESNEFYNKIKNNNKLKLNKNFDSSKNIETVILSNNNLQVFEYGKKFNPKSRNNLIPLHTSSIFKKIENNTTENSNKSQLTFYNFNLSNNFNLKNNQKNKKQLDLNLYGNESQKNSFSVESKSNPYNLQIFNNKPSKIRNNSNNFTGYTNSNSCINQNSTINSSQNKSFYTIDKKKLIENQIFKACTSTSNKSMTIKNELQNFLPIKNKVFKIRKKIDKDYLKSNMDKEIIQENDKFKSNKRFFIYPKDLMNPVYICEDEKNIMRESNYVDRLNECDAFASRNLIFNKYKVLVEKDELYGYNPDVKVDCNHIDFIRLYKEKQMNKNSFKIKKLAYNTQIISKEVNEKIFSIISDKDLKK